jgi:isopenicillin-N epimerase
MRFPAYSPLKVHWLLDEQVVFLNHGSFGACPVPVLQKQDEYRAMMERQPVKFFIRDLEELIWNSKEALAAFVGADAADMAFVPNATLGVNTIFNSLAFEEGDELLTTNHGYGACVNTLKRHAQKWKAKVVIADVPFPVSSADEVKAALLAHVTPRTKLVMMDYITSPTGLLFPVKEIVDELNRRGIDCLIDGAHAPGQIPLNLGELGAAYFTGNCHKWICSPKGSAFIHVRKDRQHLIHPISVGHTYDKAESKDRLWSNHFFWPGTDDYSAYLCVKDAIDFMGSLLRGGWSELMSHNRQQCLAARKLIAAKTGIPLPAPENMIVNLSTFDLGDTQMPAANFNYISPLWEKLWSEFRIELPVLPWNGQRPRLMFRISSQCYNSMEQYEYLAEALKLVLEQS